MNVEEAVNSFKKQFGNKIRETRLDRISHKANKKNSVSRAWVAVGSASFKEAVEHLCRIHPMPHFAVISGYQIGNDIELIYHFSLNYGSKLSEFSFNIKVKLPKSRAVLPSITDLIPGALIAEREMQEMLGVKIEGIPDGRRIFLPKNFPKGVFPWRKDETGPGKLIKNMHKGGEK